MSRGEDKEGRRERWGRAQVIAQDEAQVRERERERKRKLLYLLLLPLLHPLMLEDAFGKWKLTLNTF